MSNRAEEAALKAYPVKKEWVGNQYGSYSDVNADSRVKYQEGYEQAEKDLALTWQDIDRIIRINEVFSCEMRQPPYRSKEYCEEVLRRYQEEKEGQR